jgi:cytochrome c553
MRRFMKVSQGVSILSLLIAAHANATSVSVPNPASTPSVSAGSVSVGKAKVEQVCASCHGLNGISTADLYPNLAGQKPAYLVKQLKAFQAGERKNAIMNLMAKPLTEAEILSVAAYFSSLSKP